MTICSRLLLCLAALVLTLSQTAIAGVTLSLIPASSAVTNGDSFDVELVIAGLNAGAPPGVGAYDLNVAYDAALLSADKVVFGTGLGDPDLDTLSAADLAAPGNVNLAAVSLLDTATLIAMQPASFVLATITFSALADGNAAFGLVGDLRVDDPLGNKLAINVPEPETAALLLAGLAIGAWHLRRRRPRY